jgi:hypothetical protein
MTGISACVRLWRLVLSDRIARGPLLASCADQVVAFGRGQGGVQVGLVVAPGLACLQDGQHRGPALRPVPFQAHHLGDGACLVQDGGCGGMAGGEESDVCTRVGDGRDRIDGQVAGSVPEQVLGEEVAVQQDAPVRAQAVRAAASARISSRVTASLRTTCVPSAAVQLITSERNPPASRSPPCRCHLRTQARSLRSKSTCGSIPLGRTGSRSCQAMVPLRVRATDLTTPQHRI